MCDFEIGALDMFLQISLSFYRVTLLLPALADVSLGGVQRLGMLQITFTDLIRQMINMLL